MTVDAVVPVHPKDKELLRWCVNGIRRHLNVARILVVGNQQLKQEIERMGVIFVDEDTVIDGLTSSSFSEERWGWYFQQILKLGITDKINTDYYLVVDADTVFLREVKFFNKNGKPLYAISRECNKSYFDAVEQILGFNIEKEYSFIVHHMVFNRRIVEEMRNRFSDLHPWYMNIIRCMRPQGPESTKLLFSEYETYSHYIKVMHLDEFNIRPLRWRHIMVLPTEPLLRRLAKRYDFCSFHECLRRNYNTFLLRSWSRLRTEMSLLKDKLYGYSNLPGTIKCNY